MLSLKMSKEAYYQRKTETILSRAKEYYENDKERLREQSKNLLQRVIWTRNYGRITYKGHKQRVWQK